MGASVRGWRARTRARAFVFEAHAEASIGVTTALGGHPSGIQATAALPVTPDRKDILRNRHCEGTFSWSWLCPYMGYF